jgi:thioredoxin-related protein
MDIMKKFRYIFILLVCLSIALSANSMYSLTGVKQVYPVVEIMASKVPQNYKSTILKELNILLTKLDIDTKGYSDRAIGVLVSESYVDKHLVITMELLIGEQVRRLDISEKTFALTYQNRESFIVEDIDQLDEYIEGSLEELLDKFTMQYQEENKDIVKVRVKEGDFASQMAYERDYEKAIKRAKKSKKDVMFVLMANYCPWCRKFEDRVLMKKDINDLVHKKYIPLILNREEGKFPKEFNKSVTPIVHFISYKDSKSYKSVVGYNSRDEFLYILQSSKKSP